MEKVLDVYEFFERTVVRTLSLPKDETLESLKQFEDLYHGNKWMPALTTSGAGILKRGEGHFFVLTVREGTLLQILVRSEEGSELDPALELRGPD